MEAPGERSISIVSGVVQSVHPLRGRTAGRAHWSLVAFYDFETSNLHESQGKYTSRMLVLLRPILYTSDTFSDIGTFPVSYIPVPVLSSFQSCESFG